MESKALLCDVRPGKRPRGSAALSQLEDTMDQLAGKEGRHA
jgi:hypothetical protein